jgi:type I restriction enzyme S subunit
MSFAFYKEINFKGTPIGEIPKDWELVKLSDIAEDIYYGITAKAVENKTGLKMLRTTDIKDYIVDWDSLPFCEVTEKRGDIQRFLLKKGDLIIARAGTTGVSVLVEKDFENVIFGSYLIKVRLSRKVLPKFMRYFCQSRLYWDHITSSQAGSTLKNISLPVIRSLNVPLPSSIEEQQKIAEILSIVDEAIQKTNEIIAKTERLKKGFMQELLTKGIGHKEFKDTEIGRIPEEWEVVRLENVVEIWDKYRVPVKEQDRKPGPFPYCGANGIIDYIAGYTHDGEFVLLAEDGGFFGPFENSAYIMRGKFWANNHVHILKAIEGILINEFLMYCLNFMDLTPFLTGSTRPKLTQENTRKIPLPLPPIQEQQRIAEILTTIDRKLEIERNEKAKLERIKQGLMDLLLTGKIRVKVNQIVP